MFIYIIFVFYSPMDIERAVRAFVEHGGSNENAFIIASLTYTALKQYSFSALTAPDTPTLYLTTSLNRLDVFEEFVSYIRELRYFYVTLLRITLLLYLVWLRDLER